MLNDMNSTELFCEYYKQWIEVYKRDAIREATLAKYQMTHKWVEKLVPELKVSELIERDPTRKAIIKGKTPKVKEIKYLNQFELHTLIAHLDIKENPNWDWFILLVSKTGMRFSEALAITPADFDFARQT